jgi:hypothetical protein
MILDTVQHALMITSFVFVMMLIIEYVNVQTKGDWQNAVKRSQWLQYLLAGVLGATPGCLGAFTVVALYSHNVVSFGALVAAMIATSGDETYVMLALFPGKAVLIMLILLFVGILAGFLTDRILKPDSVLIKKLSRRLEFHEEDECICFQRNELVSQLKHLTLERGALIIILTLLIAGFLFDQLGLTAWNWVKVTFLMTSLFALFIVSTVPEHFLEKHLWEHIVKVHIPRVFLWTLGALLLMHLLLDYLNIEAWIKANYLAVLLIACLIGLIPESGPHLIFVTLYAQGAIPFGVLLSNSMVQDGHGMLPLLAESTRGFLSVKAVNLIVGLLSGLVCYLIGV